MIRYHETVWDVLLPLYNPTRPPSELQWFLTGEGGFFLGENCGMLRTLALLRLRNFAAYVRAENEASF